MSYLTIDQMIEALQEAKAQGADGAMPVAIPFGGAGRGGYLGRVEGVVRVAVAKGDVEKGISIVKTVASRGVEVLMIH